MAATSKLCRLKQCLLFLPTKLPGWYIAHERFNLLPTGLASDQFVNHVVAISRQPVATPKRQPLKRKHQNRGGAGHLGHGAGSGLGQPQDCLRTTPGQPQDNYRTTSGQPQGNLNPVPGTQAPVATQTGLGGLALTLML